jgi:hypothetical protein
MKQGIRVRILPLLAVMLLATVVVPASAYYYCCAEWVNNYDNNPDFENLGCNEENAKGFYYQLGGDSSWWGSFIYGDGQALERHWKDPSKSGSGIDYIYVDKTHFAFFSGHGYKDGSGFAFGTSQDDFKLHYNDALWGNTQMDWVTLDACKVLREDRHTNWYDAFGGLHSMTGFHTECYDVPDRGSVFVHRLIGTWTVQPITTAWFVAAKDTEPSTTYAAALARDGCWSDYVYGHGSQGTPGTSFLYSKYQC